MNGEVGKKSFHFSVLKVSFGIICSASVFTRNTRRYYLSEKLRLSAIGISRLLSLNYIENGAARLELTLKISLIGLEFYIFSIVFYLIFF
jgi:hypothetical protein